MSPVFNNVLKSVIDLISDWSIRSVETEGQNGLSLTHMVHDFISRRTQLYVFFNAYIDLFWNQYKLNQPDTMKSSKQQHAYL